MFAEVEHRAVPTAVDKRIGTVAGSGDKATPDIAVKTTKIVKRDLAS